MKIIALFFISLSLYAVEPKTFTLLYQFTKSNSSNVVIKTLMNMKVNDTCFNNKKECLAYINTKSKPIKKFGTLKGNPASTYCSAIGGDSVILKDKKSNEYDYCKLAEVYLIDSWDLYEIAKK